MGQEDGSTFRFNLAPRPVVINLQGGRRGLIETEPAFEAMELLRRHNQHKILYSYSPDYLEFIDENLPGSKVNFYEVQLKRIVITVVTVQAYRGNDFRLAHEIIDILGESAQRTIVVSTYPDSGAYIHQRQVLRFPDGAMNISSGADLFYLLWLL